MCIYNLVIVRVTCGRGIMPGCNIPINAYAAIEMGSSVGTRAVGHLLLLGQPGSILIDLNNEWTFRLAHHF